MCVNEVRSIDVFDGRKAMVGVRGGGGGYLPFHSEQRINRFQGGVLRDNNQNAKD